MDNEDRLWIDQMARQAQFIQTYAPKKFKAVIGATVREDWPEKREKAVAEVRQFIEEANRNRDRVLVISNRIAGAGPYRRYLAGLNYVLNGKGLLPHPNLTKWIEKEIEKWIERTLREEASK